MATRPVLAWSALVLGSILLCWRAPAMAQDQPKAEVEQGLQPLTRGPIHEAFAQPVVFNPKPGVTAPKKVPDPVEEMPAEQKPEGENVAWIPGYWSWEEDRKDFIWVSGIWRLIPPGRQWMPGYWHQVPDGYQWVSGYWGDSEKKATIYLPEPPESLEVGPPSEAPSDDYIWSPGNWVWYDTRYVWRPGCWIENRPGWTWYPSSYYYSPSGYTYCDGYWDYSFRRRGLCFAPVYFDSAYYTQPGFCYSPSVCLDVNLITDYFFCYPRYRHYCFGDYYASSYFSVGIYPWFSFHYSRYGCSPIYSYYNCHYARHDPYWHSRCGDDYRYRRDHAEARPARSFAAQQTLLASKPGDKETLALAKPLSQVATGKDSPVKLQPVALDRQKEIGKQSAELRLLRDQRAKLETAKPAATKPGSEVKPVKLELPKSPVLAKSGGAPERPRPALIQDAKPRLGAGTAPAAGAKPDPIRPRIDPGTSVTGPRSDPKPAVRPEPARASDRPIVDRGTRGDPPRPRAEAPPKASPGPAPSPSPSPSPRVDAPPRIRESAPRSEPPRIESRPKAEAPVIRSSPRVESPPPRIESRQADPAPRSAPSVSAPRSSPSAAPRSSPSISAPRSSPAPRPAPASSRSSGASSSSRGKGK